MNRLSDIWPTDPWGRIVNGSVAANELPIDVLTMCEGAADIAHQRFDRDLHSVYLTGEVARNLGHEPEIIVVLRQTTKPVGLDLFAAAAGLRLQKQFPQFGACKFHVYCWEEIFPADGRFSWPRFRIGVNSVSIAGRDLKRLIAPQKLTIAAANTHICGVREYLNKLIHRLRAISTESRVHATSRQFARTALDAAFAIVMTDEQVYTQDPETMASFAGLTFTENRACLAALVRLSRTGTLSGLEALAIANDTMRWLPDASDQWLDKYNPMRDEALPII